MTLLSSVRPSEGSFVASAFFALLGITAAHAMLETARDALFLSKLPASHLPVMYLAIAAVGLILSRGRAARPTRAGGGTSVAISLGVASLVSAAFWLLFRQGSPRWLLYALYVWTGTFASWLVLRFWLLLGAALTAAQARRLFGLIGSGSVLGAVLGAGLARLLVHSADVRVLLVASVVLLATALGPAVWLARLAASNSTPASQSAPSLLEADLSLVRDSPYLRRVLAIVLISTIALTLVDYLFKSAAAARCGSIEELAAFFASTYFVLNLLALMVQAIGVGWLLRLLGVHGSFLVLPVMLVVVSGGLLASGALLAVLLLKGVDGGLRHSLHRTCVELLFVPLSDGVRARTKPLVDLIGQRGGQAVASLGILLFAGLGSRRALLELALVLLCGAWAWLALDLRRHYIDVFRFALAGAPQEQSKAATEAGEPERRRQAAQHLDSLLYAPELSARERSLDALLTLRRDEPTLAIETAGLRRAIDRSLRDAYESLAARLRVTDVERSTELEDEQRSATERVFRLLSLQWPREGYDLIYRGISSGDARVHALSLELCENVCPPELRSALVGLVDKIADEERLLRAAPYYVQARAALQLPGASLTGQVLDGSDFRGANLRGANLARAQLRGARFDGADLRGANLTGVDARGASFERARLDGATLEAANFTGARGVGAVLAGCTGASPRFESGNWSEADFSHSRLDAPRFDNTDLRGARFAHSQLAQGHFQASGLVGVVFDGADLERATLSGAAVVGCSFERSRLVGSHWEVSSISRSCFDEGQCSGMTWLRCDAREVEFRASELAQTTWQESKASSSDFTGASFDSATFVDFDFVRTTLAFSKLRNLTTTRLQLIACDLHEAETEGTALPRNLLALFASSRRG
jgi:uncharacterized protein YjbI with pentapeptide repeats